MTRALASIRIRMLGMGILAVVFAAMLLGIAAVTGDGIHAAALEEEASLRMPCLARLPDEELRVVRDVLAEETHKTVVIVNERTTRSASGFEHWPMVPADAPDALHRDYLFKSFEPRCVPRVVAAPIAIRVLSMRDLRRAPRRDFWEWFHKEMGNGAAFYRVSRVGLSPDRSEAMLAVGVTYGLLSGHGDLIRAKWNGTRWVIVRRQMIWIS